VEGGKVGSRLSHVKNFYADVGLASRPCQKEKKKNCVDRQDRVQKFFKVNKETMFFYSTVEIRIVIKQIHQ
jgi:hypothetical protein